jgi:hypothetical protein
MWDEMDYSTDVSRITKGGHIEQLLKKTLGDIICFSIIKFGIRCVVYLVRIF